MAFCDRFQTLRRARGLSQEAVAERLGLSRQAVSLWESNQSQPELENLLSVADLFQVTLDELVRDRSGGHCGHPGPAVGPATGDAVVEFLVRAKRATYAGTGAEVSPTRPESHDLRYEEGTFSYYDTYLGGSAFSGEEALWDAGIPFWSMNYVGRVVGEGFSGDFLKESLALVSSTRPFRGPPLYQNGDLVYHSTVSGDFGWFQGEESIFLRGSLVYECRFHGGTVQS